MVTLTSKLTKTNKEQGMQGMTRRDWMGQVAMAAAIGAAAIADGRRRQHGARQQNPPAQRACMTGTQVPNSVADNNAVRTLQGFRKSPTTITPSPTLSVPPETWHGWAAES